MIRPSAFPGELLDVELDCRARTACVKAAIPLLDVGRFLNDVGVPLSPEERDESVAPPSLMLVACRRPVHPESEADVTVEAILDVLDQIAASGPLRVGGRVQLIEHLANAVGYELQPASASAPQPEPA